MSKKNFKELLENSIKLNLSQRFMHVYEKYKSFRVYFGVGVGVFISLSILVVYPGNSLFMQKETKKEVARTSIQLHYLSNLYKETKLFDTSESWKSTLKIGEYYINKFKVDRIQDPQFITQCIDFLSSTFTRSNSDRILFFSALKSLVVILEDTLKLNPKLFRNNEVKQSAATLLTNIRKSSEFKDKMIEFLGIKEWIAVVNLFLLLCELGVKEKKDAYKEFMKILENHEEILELLANENFIARVFKDSVSEDLEISQLAIEMIGWMAKDLKVAEYMISSHLVFNLISKVVVIHSGNKHLVAKVIELLNIHGPDIWRSAKLDKEKQRLKEIGKKLQIPSLKKMLENINRT